MNFTMMKFRAMMLCLLVMLFAGSLISCSSDDDDSPKRETPTEDTEVPTSGTAMFYFTPSEGDLLLCDVTIEYTDASGKLQTETITGEWKKQIKFASLPANGTIAIKRSLKANVELAKDHYKFGYTEQSVFYANYASGAKPAGHNHGSSANISIGKDKVEHYVVDRHPVIISYSYTIDKKKDSDGSFVTFGK